MNKNRIIIGFKSLKGRKMKVVMLAFLLASCMGKYVVTVYDVDKDKNRIFACREETGAGGYSMMLTLNMSEANAFCEKMREKK